jgi:peptidoglycan/LPS O-acetylase OafA/YrhL
MEMTYLKGLNGIRALAALSVVVGHINNAVHSPHTEDSSIASYAVTVFFSLSGFLITYLLLKERDKQPIDIKKFYIRRILRIWPLYFLYMSIAVVFTTTAIFPNLLYYIFFVPNIPMVFGGGISLLGHYWSLGVEEQFYLFWPWLVKKSANVLMGLCAFTALVLVVKLCLNVFIGGWSPAYSLFYLSRFDCMAIGGIGAFLFQQGSKLIPLFSSTAVQLASWLIMALMMIGKFKTFSIIDHEIVSGVAVLLIIGQIATDKPLINLENRALNFLGKISFGIYVFHPLIIEWIIQLPFNTIGDPLNQIVIYFAVLSATIIVAGVSYNCFEKYFLVLKNKYAFENTARRTQGPEF